MALVEKVCLYYREGSSDKVYEIHLTEEDGAYRVTGYNGRRGTKLVAQPKTPRPVPYRTARLVFDNLEAAKLNHPRTPYRVASRETAADINQSAIDAGRHEPTGPQLKANEKAGEPQSYAAQFLDALEL